MQSRIRRFTATLAIFSLLAGALLPSLAAAAAGDAATPPAKKSSVFDDLEKEESFINTSGNLADEETSPPMFDLLVLRPLGIGAMALGAAFFIPSALMTVLTRPTEINKPVKDFILRPAKYVWVDPIGSH